MSSKKFTRRKFVGSLPCLALGTTSLYSSLINLRAINSLIGSSNSIDGDYKALVCILLSGGNDSYNMLVPTSAAEYNEYATVRSNQAIPKEDLLAIDPNTNDGREFGIHPSMTRLHNLFEQGDLAFVSNVGTLVEPTTKSGFINKTMQVPLGLFSHSDQQMHWQTAFPQDRTNIGWGGKIADILQSLNSNNEVSMNISLGGNNIFQRGQDVFPYAINNTEGGISIFGWENLDPMLSLMTEDVTDIVNKQYEDIFKDSYTGVLKRSIESNEHFNLALDQQMPLMTQFSSSNLSLSLNMIARAISARETLGAKRQIFFVTHGGFDNHDELLNNHAARLSILDNAMAEFYEATVELGISDCVTTFTISDFARTLSSNGNGTDHAWGGNAMVMGGAVKGKDMYGEYPTLSLNTDLELGGGVLIPTTSADEYFAEIALWFGISPNDLSLVLPNIGNFYDTASQGSPLGFLL